MTLWDILAQAWVTLPEILRGAIMTLGVTLILWVGNSIRVSEKWRKLRLEIAEAKADQNDRNAKAEADSRQFVLETARASELRIDAITADLKEITVKYQDLRLIVAHKDGQIDVLTKQLAESMHETVAQKNASATAQRQVSELGNALRLTTKQLNAAQTEMGDMKKKNDALQREVSRLEQRVEELESTQAKNAATKTEPGL